MSDISIKWGLLLNKNPQAVQEYIDGGSVRSMINKLDDTEARTEAYRVEKLGVVLGRTRARRALSRRLNSSVN